MAACSSMQINSTARAFTRAPQRVVPHTSVSYRAFARPTERLTIRKQPTWVVRAGKIREVTEEELEVEVANRDCPLIIDFFATWCGPCVLLARELEQVAEEMGDSVKIIKIDCDKNEQISAALQIQGLPTLIFVGMDPNKPALRTEGLLPAQAIIDIVQKEFLTPTEA